MKYRTLGKTGLSVSEIGFGTWGIGGATGGDVAYGPTDDEESRAALDRAFELGVTFYDTSDLYGFGHSEELLGQVFKDRREKVVIATKAGFVKQGESLAKDFSAAHLRQSLEASLQRLQTDYVDLFFLHSPPLAVLENDPAPLQALAEFRQAGKIRAFGISVNSPAEAAAATTFGAAAVQVNFNLVDQRVVENGFLRLAEAEKVGVIVRTPLCFGFLGGGYSASMPFDRRDHRAHWSLAQLEVWTNASEVFAPLLNFPGQTQNQLALRYCLSYPEVTTVIPGMLTRAHVEENLRASDLGPYAGELRSKLEEAYQGNRFFLGKGK